MRVVYYGRDLFHAGTGQERQNHKYIARIPFGDKFRYFYNQAELAAYKAGKGVQGAAKAVSDAANNAGKKIGYTGEKLRSKVNYEKGKKILQKQYEKQFASGGKTNSSLGDVARKDSSSLKNQAVRAANKANKFMSNLGSSISKSADRAVNNVKNFGATKLGTTKGKNANMHSGNQGVVNATTGKNNKPKNNQGTISNRMGQRAMENQKVDYDRPATGRNNSPKNNQGTNITTGRNNSPKYNQGSNYSAKVKKEAEQEAKKGQVNNAKRQKAIEASYYQSYINDGWAPENARKYAKKAAESYMKKHS